MDDEFSRSIDEVPHLPVANPIDTAKKLQILDGARKVFLADGFDGASMNEIARMAGVSKGTLYVYFDSKEALFEDLVRFDKRQQAERLFDVIDNDQDVRSTLQDFGEKLIGHLSSPEALAQVRTIVGISGKLPQIGRAFYQAGPAFGIDKLARYLDRQVEKGALVIDDTRYAANTFGDLCQGGALKARLFGMDVDMSPPAIKWNVERACALFLKVYGAPKRG